MTQATIIFTDGEDDEVNLKFDFGEGGVNDKSSAHQLAVIALKAVKDYLAAEDLK